MEYDPLWHKPEETPFHLNKTCSFVCVFFSSFLPRPQTAPTDTLVIYVTSLFVPLWSDQSEWFGVRPEHAVQEDARGSAQSVVFVVSRIRGLSKDVYSRFVELEGGKPVWNKPQKQFVRLQWRVNKISRGRFRGKLKREEKTLIQTIPSRGTRFFLVGHSTRPYFKYEVVRLEREWKLILVHRACDYNS